MIPQDTRVMRRAQRRAWRGTPTGRRATHQVVTAYGRHQKERDRAAAWRAAREESAATAGEG